MVTLCTYPIRRPTPVPSARGWTISATTQACRLVSDIQLGRLASRGVGLALCPAEKIFTGSHSTDMTLWN